MKRFFVVAHNMFYTPLPRRWTGMAVNRRRKHVLHNRILKEGFSPEILMLGKSPHDPFRNCSEEPSKGVVIPLIFPNAP